VPSRLPEGESREVAEMFAAWTSAWASGQDGWNLAGRDASRNAAAEKEKPGVAAVPKAATPASSAASASGATPHRGTQPRVVEPREKSRCSCGIPTMQDMCEDNEELILVDGTDYHHFDRVEQQRFLAQKYAAARASRGLVSMPPASAVPNADAVATSGPLRTSEYRSIADALQEDAIATSPQRWAPPMVPRVPLQGSNIRAGELFANLPDASPKGGLHQMTHRAEAPQAQAAFPDEAADSDHEEYANTSFDQGLLEQAGRASWQVGSRNASPSKPRLSTGSSRRRSLSRDTSQDFGLSEDQLSAILHVPASANSLGSRCPSKQNTPSSCPPACVLQREMADVVFTPRDGAAEPSPRTMSGDFGLSADQLHAFRQSSERLRSYGRRSFGSQAPSQFRSVPESPGGKVEEQDEEVVLDCNLGASTAPEHMQLDVSQLDESTQRAVLSMAAGAGLSRASVLKLVGQQAHPLQKLSGAGLVDSQGDDSLKTSENLDKDAPSTSGTRTPLTNCAEGSASLASLELEEEEAVEFDVTSLEEEARLALVTLVSKLQPRLLTSGKTAAVDEAAAPRSGTRVTMLLAEDAAADAVGSSGLARKKVTVFISDEQMGALQEQATPEAKCPTEELTKPTQAMDELEVDAEKENIEVAMAGNKLQADRSSPVKEFGNENCQWTHMTLASGVQVSNVLDSDFGLGDDQLLLSSLRERSAPSREDTCSLPDPADETDAGPNPDVGQWQYPPPAVTSLLFDKDVSSSERKLSDELNLDLDLLDSNTRETVLSAAQVVRAELCTREGGTPRRDRLPADVDSWSPGFEELVASDEAVDLVRPDAVAVVESLRWELSDIGQEQTNSSAVAQDDALDVTVELNLDEGLDADALASLDKLRDQAMSKSPSPTRDVWSVAGEGQELVDI